MYKTNYMKDTIKLKKQIESLKQENEQLRLLISQIMEILENGIPQNAN